MEHSKSASRRANKSVEYMEAMGVPVWVRRKRSGSGPASLNGVPSSAAADGVNLKAPRLADLSAVNFPAVLGRMKLAPAPASGQCAAIGGGHSGLMVLAELDEANGKGEAELYEGKAGRLLSKMLNSINIQRIETFFGCLTHEMAGTAGEEGTVAAEIERLSPRALLLMIHPRKSGASLAELRQGAPNGLNGAAVFASLHPAWLLRHQGDKRLAWEDLKAVRKLLQSSRGA